MTACIVLRDVLDTDLDTFFAFESDPVAIGMAAFTSKDPTNRDAFDSHWRRIRANAAIQMRTIIFEGAIAGNVMTYPQDGNTEITYWIGREFWGKGVATGALLEFIRTCQPGDLHARVAADNTASIRVLIKCGFCEYERMIGYANARAMEISEIAMRRIAHAAHTPSSSG